ncbi:ATP-binding cassette domain-containing protein, partial [candidate division KSB3 bacterium]|nr:ATP-binding cassette domain-containing protein [candidate division KSB3 bacterium]MBD3323372.1 ATP-binding cassette domain-containing protein [candidate division KSB3 bacterium]
TTIAKLMNRLLSPSKGQVLFPERQANSLAAFPVGVVFADPETQIVGTTVEEDVAFGLGNLQVPSSEMRIRVDRALERVGLRNSVRRSPHELSGGEQQKLCIASILAMEPVCLVLDEPFTFLDRTSRQELLNVLLDLHAEGQTIIALSSDPEDLVAAQRILVLRQGMLLTECSPQTLWKTPGILRQSGIRPPDLLRFRLALCQQGYSLREDSLTPEAIADEIGRVETSPKHGAS